MPTMAGSFETAFNALVGFPPFNWQHRLFRCFVEGHIPSAINLPTGMGKTSVMAIWLIGRAYGAPLPRRLVYVVDRRVVVDQASEEAERIVERLDANDPIASNLRARLGIDAGG